MRSYCILILIILFPIFLAGQILSEEITLIHDYGSERWENVRYDLRQYVIKDSVVKMSLEDVLNIDSLTTVPTGWKYLMFVESKKDSIIYRIELQDAPYKLSGLKGFFKIHDIEVLFYNKIPTFLESTKLSKKFHYDRHLYRIREDTWIEFSGDDCSHSWTLFFSNNSFYIKNVH